MQIRMFFLKAVAVASFALWVGSVPTSARTQAEEDANAMYEALKVFTLSGGAMRAENVTLKRDRAEMNCNAGETFSISVQYEDDFLFEGDRLRGCYYPILTNEWYPRHGFLQSSIYKLRFLHRRSDIVAARGVLEGTQAVEGNANERVSNWRIDVPVKMFTFGVGRFEPHAEEVQL